jgi:RimJ/RimL family protein N-acetyltransferase
MKALVIKYKRIALRHMLASDLPTLVPVLTNPETRGVYNTTRIGSPHAIEKRYRDDGFSNEDHEMLLVCDASGAVIGDVSHFRARRYSSSREIGWTIHNPEHRNQGYATEAVTALVDYLFQAFEINRVECNTATTNLASLRLAEKCGFTYEGVSRGLVFVGGVYLDDAVFSVLRSEWEQVAAARLELSVHHAGKKPSTER